MNIEKAYNGKEALIKLQNNSRNMTRSAEPYTLLMLDNNMPVMNGEEAA